MELVRQLQDCKFILVQSNNKIRISAKDMSYTYDEIKKIDTTNYGVLLDGIVVIDFDYRGIGEEMIKHMPITFTVATPHGIHVYYRLSNNIGNSELKKKGVHIGDIKNGKSSYVLGPGSKINNNEYTVISDVDIATIDEQQLNEMVKTYKQKSNKRIRPCFINILNSKPTIQMTGTEGHSLRVAMVAELHVNDFEVFEIIALFERQDDFDQSITEYQVNNIIDTNINPWTCETIQEKCGSIVTSCDDCHTQRKRKDTNQEKEEKIEAPTNEELQYLKDENLLENILQKIHANGMVAEDYNLLVLINVSMLRFVKNFKRTSANIIVSDESGKGKDVLIQSVTDALIPKKDYIHFSSGSSKAILYLSEDMPSLDGKVIHIEDVNEDYLNSDEMKVFASGSLESITVRDQRALHLTVKGKPILFVSSSKMSFDGDMQRRWSQICVESQMEKTRRVVLDKCKIYELDEQDTTKDAYIKPLRHLKVVNVVIQNCRDTIYRHLPKEIDISMMTQIDKMLNYISASAALHQYQRERTDKGSVIANGFDVAYGVLCFDILNAISASPLSRHEKELVDILRKHGPEPMTISEIRKEERKHLTGNQIRNRSYDGKPGFMDKLEAKGIIRICDKDLGGGYNVLAYGVNSGKFNLDCREVFEFFSGILGEFGSLAVFSRLRESIDASLREMGYVCIPYNYNYRQNENPSEKKTAKVCAKVATPPVALREEKTVKSAKTQKKQQNDDKMPEFSTVEERLDYIKKHKVTT